MLQTTIRIVETLKKIIRKLLVRKLKIIDNKIFIINKFYNFFRENCTMLLMSVCFQIIHFILLYLSWITCTIIDLFSSFFLLVIPKIIKILCISNSAKDITV